MLIIIFLLVFTLGLLWYQRKTNYKTNPWLLAGIWFVICALLNFIESYVATTKLFAEIYVRQAMIAIFYVPAVYFSARSAKRSTLPLWKSFILFLALSGVATLIAAMFLAAVPLAVGYSG